MEVKVYLASTGKGFRKQDGRFGYLIEMTEGGKTASRAFRSRYENLTDNQAFLTALVRAGRYLSRLKVEKIRIFTPNDYTVANYYSLKKWKEMGWKRKDQTIKNADLWRQVDEVYKGIPLDMTLEKGGKVRELEEMLGGE